MKYGLIYYRNTGNIGDDIQSYAASNFLPQIDYLIDREHIDMFKSTDNNQVAVIMNAWYTYDIFNFGISPYIFPKLISMHFTDFKFHYSEKLLKNFKELDYIDEETRKTFNSYGPVGARDMQTMKNLQEIGVQSYFSGCLTLTLNKFEFTEKEDYICAVGLTDEEIRILKNKTSLKIKIIKQDIPEGSIANETWQKRKERIEDILKTYQKAQMVITTKLHCALPSLALETPVLLLYDKQFGNRIDSFKELFNYIPRENLKSLLNLEIIDNPKDYLKIRQNLIKDCKEFIETAANKENKINLNYVDGVDFCRNKTRNMKRIIDNLINGYLKAEGDKDWYYSRLAEIEEKIYKIPIHKEIKEYSVDKKIQKIEEIISKQI